MKRYVVFAGDRCYAQGGACDYLLDFSVKKEAIDYRRNYVQQSSHNRWAHVWDTKTMTIYPTTEEDDDGFSMGIA